MDPINVLREGEMHDEEMNKNVARQEDPLRGELMTGIPNEVTLTHIAAKLPRRAYEKIANLNPDWQRAFQGRMVYDERVRTNATEEFLLVSCHFLTNVSHDQFTDLTVDKMTLSLFSPSEKRWYKIPPAPGCHEGVLHNECARAISDGSLYLVGGKKSRKICWVPSAEVFVLDLGRYPSEWRQCATMKVARLDPTVRVMHGKIFVFGGYASSGDFEFELRNEVYDPSVDTWSFIASPTPLVSIHEAFSVRQQFFACVGTAPIDPVHDFLDKDLGTKFVVTVDNEGPKIRSTEDPDAEDHMDGLHEFIEKELGDGPIVPSGDSPQERLASTISHYEECHPSSIFLFYDPVNDEWRQFDKEMLKTATVDEHLPIHAFKLRENDDGSDQDDDGPRENDEGSDQDDDGPEPDDHATVYVWSISL